MPLFASLTLVKETALKEAACVRLPKYRLTVTAMMVVLKLSSNQKGNQTFLNVKIPETLGL